MKLKEKGKNMYNNDKERAETFKKKIKKINSRIRSKDSKIKFFKSLNVLKLEIEKTILELEEIENIITELEFDEFYKGTDLSLNFKDKTEKNIEFLYDFDEKIKMEVFSLKEKLLKNIKENE